jgi:hypothetical protein
MKVLKLITAMIFALLAAPLAAEGQPAGKVYRIGFLAIGAPYWKDSSLVEAFRQGLRDAGWIEGQTLTIDIDGCTMIRAAFPVWRGNLSRYPST